MKKFITFLFIILSFSFFGCDLIFDKITTDIKDYYDDYEDNYEDDYENEYEDDEKINVDMNFSVQAFSEDSVVLQWSTDLSNIRYNIYVKDSSGYIQCVKENYGKTNYFVVSDDQSAYSIGILLDEREIYTTNFIYPELEDEKGFPVHAEISETGNLGVEFFYPSNVELFSLKGQKENGETFQTTTKYPAEEMKSFLLPIIYDENSHNNWITVIFTIDDVEYVSAKYYFDYSAHTEAEKNGSVTFYPSL